MSLPRTPMTWFDWLMVISAIVFSLIGLGLEVLAWFAG